MAESHGVPFSDQFLFTWEIPEEGGFFWQKEGRELILLQKAGTTFFRLSTAPIDSPIHVWFANVPVTPEGVLLFAYQLGRLTRSNPETFSDWKREIEDMNEALGIWDLIDNWKEKELRQLFAHKNLTEADMLADAGLAEDAIGKGDVVRLAYVYLLNCLAWRKLKGRFNVQPWFDVAEERPRLITVPQDLLSLIWLSFMLSVVGGRQGRQCIVCKTWFAVGHIPEPGRRAVRGDRTLCSFKCRTRHYRQRMERARAMHAEGKSPDEIAQVLDVKKKILKGWLQRKG
jgi:hypothetical protein